jgi:hypothetical protein
MNEPKKTDAMDRYLGHSASTTMMGVALTGLLALCKWAGLLDWDWWWVLLPALLAIPSVVIDALILAACRARQGRAETDQGGERPAGGGRRGSAFFVAAARGCETIGGDQEALNMRRLEWVLVGVAVGLLGTAILPGLQVVQWYREAQARARCEENLRDIDLAVWKNEAVMMPPSTTNQQIPDNSTWLLWVTPYLEQNSPDEEAPDKVKTFSTPASEDPERGGK